MKLAFEVPTLYIPDFANLQDFRVARAAWAMCDPKYRERLRPIDLLLADPMPLEELRRVASLTRPVHVTITLPSDVAEATVMLEQVSLVTDGELAVIAPVEAVEAVLLALDHEVSIIAIPRSVGAERVRWAQEISENARASPVWIHFLELQGLAEYREIVESGLSYVSLHTALPWRAAFHSVSIDAAAELPDEPILTQRVTPEQAAQARVFMEAMRAVAVA